MIRSKSPSTIFLVLAVGIALIIAGAVGYSYFFGNKNASANLSLQLVDQGGNVLGNYIGQETPLLAMVYNSPLSGGGTTQIEILPSYEFWITPVVKVNFEKNTVANPTFALKLKVTERSATWGGQAIDIQNFQSTVMEKTFTPKPGVNEFSGVGNGKILCSDLLASPPTASAPSKQLKVQYTIVAELYSNGVLISSSTSTVSATLDFAYKPDGTVSITNVNIVPTFVQVI
ncbi:MAG: hypothetical protein ABC596_09360 [Candidatus Methanosuratincola petrocarbonis]